MATFGNNSTTNNVFVNVKRVTIKGISFDITIKSSNLSSKEESQKYADFFDNNLEAVQDALQERLEVTGSGISGASATRKFDEAAEL